MLKRFAKLIGFERARVVVGLARDEHAQSLARRPIGHRAILAAAIAWMVITVPIGCEREEAVVYRAPEIAGVVEVVDATQPESLVVDLLDGRQVSLEREGLQTPIGGGPAIGELLLAGHEGTKPWVVGLRVAGTRGLPADCYRVVSMGHDQGAAIAMDVGLLLQRAPTFDPGLATGGRYSFDTGSFCLNDRGEVTSYQQY